MSDLREFLIKHIIDNVRYKSKKYMIFEIQTIPLPKIMKCLDLGFHAMMHEMAKVNQQCHIYNEPLLTALIVSSKDGKPGKGFWDDFIKYYPNEEIDLNNRHQRWVMELGIIKGYYMIKDKY